MKAPAESMSPMETTTVAAEAMPPKSPMETAGVAAEAMSPMETTVVTVEAMPAKTSMETAGVTAEAMSPMETTVVTAEAPAMMPLCRDHRSTRQQDDDRERRDGKVRKE